MKKEGGSTGKTEPKKKVGLGHFQGATLPLHLAQRANAPHRGVRESGGQRRVGARCGRGAHDCLRFWRSVLSSLPGEINQGREYGGEGKERKIGARRTALRTEGEHSRGGRDVRRTGARSGGGLELTFGFL